MSNTLSSDILEQQFGPTKIEILFQETNSRIICTKTIPEGKILELSYVIFLPEGIQKYPSVHQVVVDGESMGKAFQAAAINFQRQVRSAYSFSLPDSFCRWFKNDEPATVVSVLITVGTEKTPYASILETYSPAVVWPTSQGPASDDDLQKIDLFDKFLTGAG